MNISSIRDFFKFQTVEETQVPTFLHQTPHHAKFLQLVKISWEKSNV